MQGDICSETSGAGRAKQIYYPSIHSSVFYRRLSWGFCLKHLPAVFGPKAAPTRHLQAVWGSQFTSRVCFLDCWRKPEYPQWTHQNMQTFPEGRTRDLLAVRRQCEPLHHHVANFIHQNSKFKRMTRCLWTSGEACFFWSENWQTRPFEL